MPSGFFGVSHPEFSMSLGTVVERLGEVWSVGVRIHLGVDLRHVDLGCHWQHLVEQLGAADDPDLAAVESVVGNGLLTGHVECLLQIVHHGGTRRTEITVTRQHDVVTFRKRPELLVERLPRPCAP